MPKRRVPRTTPDMDPVARFCPGEDLIVQSLRVWAANRTLWSGVCDRFHRTLPLPLAGAGLRSFRQLIEVVGRSSRRTIWLACPGSSTVTADERSLLVLLAALQAGDWNRARSLAEWLLPRDSQRPALAAASVLARVLEKAGLALYLPQPRQAAPPSAAALRVAV